MYACIIFKHSENNTTLRFIIIIIIIDKNVCFILMEKRE